MTAPKTDDYSAKDIKKLSQREHVRHRIGMYLGSNSDEGITVGIREFCDNSTDEALAGYGNHIKVTFHADGSGEVSDNARGLPVDKTAEGMTGVEATLGQIGSGGKFNADNYKTSGGLNGVGASAMVAASSRTDVIVYRGGKKHELSFKEGIPGFFSKPNDPFASFKEDHDLKVSPDTRSAAEKKASPTGTTVRFWPDHTVFLPESKFLVEDIKSRVKSTAFLVKGLSFTVNDFRDPENPRTDVYAFDGGLVDMVPTISHHPLVTKPIYIHTSGSFEQKASVMTSEGKMTQADVVREVDIEVAFAYTNAETINLWSHVNIIRTNNGGSHEAGLWRAMSRVLVNHVKNTRGLLKAKEEAPTMEDVKDGFVGVISVKFPEPTFTGQEKSNLATPQILSVVSQTVGAELQKWLNDKKNAAQVKIIGQKIVEASRIRLAAKQQKDIQRKKSALETAASMPAKLLACVSEDVSVNELQLCEGDSALAGLKSSRDSNVTAIYPLRGKPLNAYDLSVANILKNQEWSDMIQILGAGFGKEFDVDQMRYGKVIILADSDADGSHIRALLVTGFWRLFREMVVAGRVYVAMPPLFSVTLAGKNKERFYALNEEERDALLIKLEKQGKKIDIIQRHKGLGEYSADILAEVVMDPATRVLKQVTVEDVEAFEATLELTMGKNASNRRDWIVENRAMVSADEIDA